MKCIGKVILVIMELLIPILVQVHANDLASTSFGPSSLPIHVSDVFELDKVQGPMEECLRPQIKYCKRERWLHEDQGLYDRCIHYSFLNCMHHIRGNEDPTMTPLIKMCTGDCARKQELNIHIQACLLKCYEDYIQNLPKIYNEHIEYPATTYGKPIKNPSKISQKLTGCIKKFLKHFTKNSDVVYAQNPSVATLDLVNSLLFLSLSKTF
jgi:hypothetical protein